MNEVGGAESVISDLINSSTLVSLDNNSYLIIGKEIFLSKFDPKEKAERIFSKSGYGIIWRIALAMFLNKNKYDIVIVHGLPPFTLWIIALMTDNCILAYDHGTFNIKTSLFKSFKNLITIIEWKLFISAVITNSNYSLNLIHSKLGYSFNCKVIPLPISLVKGYEFNRTHNNFIGYLGRISFLDKGTDMLVPLAQQLIQKNVDFKFVVAGDGPDLKRLKDSIVRTHLDSYFIFVGVIENKIDYFSSINCMISTSRTETFGISIMEAIYYNTPVCAFDVGAIREIFGTYSEVKIIPPFDIHLAANALASILDADIIPFHSHQRTREHIEKSYSLNEFFNSLHTFALTFAPLNSK